MVPDILFKYTSSKTALINLETNKLRWSSPKLFNDPSEFKRIPSFSPSLDEAIKMFPEIILKVAKGNYKVDENKLALSTSHFLQLAKHCVTKDIDLMSLLKGENIPTSFSDIAYAEVMKQYVDNELINQARIICLTNIPTNPAMWANYADSNSGCLLGFRHLPKLDTPFQTAKRVVYSPEKSIVGSGLDFLLYGGTPEIFKATFNDICFTKRKEWSYEEEWRVMTLSYDEDHALCGDYKFYEDELESVTFGLKATEDTKLLVKDAVTRKYHNCALFQMHELDGELIRTPI